MSLDTAPGSDYRDQLTRLALWHALRQAGLQLDRMWMVASAEGSPEAMGLADAVQGVHRALVALSPA